MKICSRCIYDEEVPGIEFDSSGLCNYCLQIEDIQETFKTGTPEGERNF